MVIESELYDRLNIPHNSNRKQIKDSFVELAKTLHPDKTRQESPEYTAISDAYKILSDPQLKRIYDIYGIAGIRNNADGIPQPHHQTFSRTKPETTTINVTQFLKLVVIFTVASTGILLAYKNETFQIFIKSFSPYAEILLKTGEAGNQFLNSSSSSNGPDQSESAQDLDPPGTESAQYFDLHSIEDIEQINQEQEIENIEDDISALVEFENVVNSDVLFLALKNLSKALNGLKSACILWSEPFQTLENKLKHLQERIWKSDNNIRLKYEIEELANEIYENIKNSFNPAAKDKLNLETQKYLDAIIDNQHLIE